MNNKNQNTQSNIVPELTPEQQPQSQKLKKPKWLIPVIVIVGVIVLGLVVWAGYSIFKPAPPEDEFANWKTYQNEEYGWEIRYPENWKKEEAEGSLGTFVLDRINFNKSDVENLAMRTDNITVNVISKESVKELIPIWFSRVEIEKEEERKLNEINWHMIYHKEGAHRKGISVLTEQVGRIYEISFSSPNETDFLERSSIFNQILSTFKFLESNISEKEVAYNLFKDIVNWKTKDLVERTWFNQCINQCLDKFKHNPKYKVFRMYYGPPEPGSTTTGDTTPSIHWIKSKLIEILQKNNWTKYADGEYQPPISETYIKNNKLLQIVMSPSMGVGFSINVYFEYSD